MRTPLALVACLVGACDGADPGDTVDAATADAAPSLVVHETKTLQPGEVIEATLTGGPGARAVITLTAPSPTLDWNLHGHAGGSSQTIMQELGVASASYTFEPPAQAVWYLMLRSKQPAAMDVVVDVALYGDLQWSGWL